MCRILMLSDYITVDIKILFIGFTINWNVKNVHKFSTEIEHMQ